MCYILTSWYGNAFCITDPWVSYRIRKFAGCACSVNTQVGDNSRLGYVPRLGVAPDRGTPYLDRGTPKLSSWLCRKQFARNFNHKVNNFSIVLELPARLIIYLNKDEDCGIVFRFATPFWSCSGGGHKCTLACFDLNYVSIRDLQHIMTDGNDSVLSDQAMCTFSAKLYILFGR